MSNLENSSTDRPTGEQTIRVVFILAIITIVLLLVFSYAETGRVRMPSFVLGICIANIGMQLPGAARRIFATTPAFFAVERIGLVCAGLCVVTAMVSAFVPITPEMTAFRLSMMTSSVLAIVTLVVFFYLRRKAR